MQMKEMFDKDQQNALLHDEKKNRAEIEKLRIEKMMILKIIYESGHI